MTTVKHAFTNPKADGADATIARPSDWNADHVLQDGAALQMDNKCLNADFARRTIFGLAMPEALPDANGFHKIDFGAVPTVTANIMTFGAANNEISWPKGHTADGTEPTAWVWRDFRASATFKAIAIAGIYELRMRVDATHWCSVKQNNGNFTIDDHNGGANIVFSNAQVLTINRWYWEDIERQNVSTTVKIYDTGGTTPGVTKSSSTLLQTGTTGSAIGGTNNMHISITSDQAAAQWGGIATGNGGVYVEMSGLPESWDVAFSGTLGGQAVGFDESANAGPVGKQWALRTYVPATSRTIAIGYNNTDLPRQFGNIVPSATYVSSMYVKCSGETGTQLVAMNAVFYDSANARTVSGGSSYDGGVTVWTRVSRVDTVTSLTVSGRIYFGINQGTNSTGTAWLMLPQLEQGGAATAWRESPYDAAPIVAQVSRAAGTDLTTTSAAFVEPDSRDLAMNFFAPYDCTLSIDVQAQLINGTLGAQDDINVTVDGVSLGPIWRANQYVANYAIPVHYKAVARVAAGKHRIALVWRTSAGTLTLQSSAFPTYLTVTAGRGK